MSAPAFSPSAVEMARICAESAAALADDLQRLNPGWTGFAQSWSKPANENRLLPVPNFALPTPEPPSMRRERQNAYSGRPAGKVGRANEQAKLD